MLQKTLGDLAEYSFVCNKAFLNTLEDKNVLSAEELENLLALVKKLAQYIENEHISMNLLKLDTLAQLLHVASTGLEYTDIKSEEVGVYIGHVAEMMMCLLQELFSMQELKVSK